MLNVLSNLSTELVWMVILNYYIEKFGGSNQRTKIARDMIFTIWHAIQNFELLDIATIGEEVSIVFHILCSKLPLYFIPFYSNHNFHLLQIQDFLFSFLFFFIFFSFFFCVFCVFGGGGRWLWSIRAWI